MGIITWLIFGLIAGALAKLILPGDDPGSGGFGGLLVTIGIGIVGAIIGGFIGTAIGWGTVSSFDFRSLALAVVGGILFLALLRALSGRRVAWGVLRAGPGRGSGERTAARFRGGAALTRPAPIPPRAKSGSPRRA
jgi:uncharacterized membrane protein YeaQ/YmgE (transglycosylase-associated protein family)